MRPFFGLHLPTFGPPGTPAESIFDHALELTLAAEEAGFEFVTVMDHFYQIGGVGPEDGPMLEAYTMLAALAARTERIRLGTLVTGVTYRNPAMLAKTVTTLDVISRGRALLGIGAAWNEDEHRGYGFDFPPIGERMDRLDEALTIAGACSPRSGPASRAATTGSSPRSTSPRPIQPGGPRILVGGGGEQRTLRIVGAVRGHDATGSRSGPRRSRGRAISSPLLRGDRARSLDHQADDLRAGGDRARREGGRRHPRGIPPERRSVMAVATPDRAVEILSGFIEMGFTGFTFGNTQLPTVESVHLAGEVLRKLG